MASDSEKTYSEDRSKEEARDKEDEDYTKCECNRFCMRNCCCTWNVYWQAAVFSSIIFVYLLLGAAIFMALEGPNEQQRIAEAEINRSRLIQVGQYVVGNLTASGQLNESEAQELVFLISNLSQAFSNLDTSRNWDFAPAVFFSVTVVTTIGNNFGCVFATQQYYL